MLVHVSDSPTNVHTEQMLDSVTVIVCIGAVIEPPGSVVYAQLLAGVTLVSIISESVEPEHTQKADVTP
jgi:hypothetical protein